MWMETLPSMAQANILGFLNVEHRMFHAKDLELLAQNLLSGFKLDFWVARGAKNLLNKVGCSKNFNQEEQMRQYPLPSWLPSHQNETPLLPWMPLNFQQQASTAKQSPQEKVNSGVEESRHIEVDAQTRTEGIFCGKGKLSQDGEDAITGLQTPPHHSEGCKITSEEWPLPTVAQTDQNEKFSILSENFLEGLQQDPRHFRKDDSSLSALAHSLKEAWMERQPTFDDLNDFSAMPDASMFFKILKPWEMKDDTVLSMIKVFLGKDWGFGWSAQIFSYCLLPKLVLLEQSASRVLVSAVIEAGKAHPRAAIDTLLIPLLLSEEGPTKAQCDVINRVLKECLSDNQIFSFCGKIFLSNRRQVLPFADPPFVRESFLSKSVIWTDPAWTVLQNLLSRAIELDTELLEVLVTCCGEEAVKFSKSLKFCNLLLCLLSRFGACLQPCKTKLQRIAEQTETFMSKALMAKASAL